MTNTTRHQHTHIPSVSLQILSNDVLTGTTFEIQSNIKHTLALSTWGLYILCFTIANSSSRSNDSLCDLLVKGNMTT